MGLGVSVVSNKVIRQMGEAYAFAKRRQRVSPTSFVPISHPNVEGVLLTDLPPATDTLTGKTSAWAQRLQRNDDGDLELAGGNTTTNPEHYFPVINRLKSLDLKALTYIVCKCVNGEIRWDSGECEPGDFDVGPGPNGSSGGSIPFGGGIPTGGGSFGGGPFGDGGFGG